jgi:hypothetical protein
VSALFFLSLERQREKTNRYWRRDRTQLEEGWQGVSESAASAKRSWVWFGANPAHSETPVQAAVKLRLPGGGAVGKRSGAAWKAGRCSLRLIFISANALGGLRHGVDSGFQHSESLDEVVERKRLVNKHFAHCLVVFSQQLVQRLVRHKFHRCWKSGIVIRPS